MPNMWQNIIDDPTSSDAQRAAAQKMLDSTKSEPTSELTTAKGNVTLPGSRWEGAREVDRNPIVVSPEWAQRLQNMNRQVSAQKTDEEVASSARFFLWDGLMTLSVWGNKTEIRYIGGKDRKYDEFFKELQGRYPEENISERLIEHTKEQDAYYADLTIRSQEAAKQEEAEQAAAEDEIRRTRGLELKAAWPTNYELAVHGAAVNLRIDRRRQAGKGDL
jgi:hypothetical protein